jgi:chitosanase
MIHSGSILWVIRNKFPETTPSAGGNEKKWIEQYVKARQQWLATHPRPAVRSTTYRTKCFQREIQRANWDLSQVPVNANGAQVSS